jgi:predicted nucleic acid-binding protein
VATGGEPLRVLLDTNVLCGDWRLDHSATRLLLLEAENNRLQLLVPELVIREAVRRFGEDVNRLRGTITKSVKDLRRYGYDEAIARSLYDSIEEGVHRYEMRLRESLRNARAEVLDFPDIPHERISNRVIERRKPIKANGSGYHDALIWEIVLSNISSTETLYFVSENTRDFAAPGDKGGLAGDLLQDLTEMGYPQDSVVLHPNLRSFVDDLIKPSYEVRQLVDQIFAQGTDAFDKLEQYIDGALGDQLQGSVPSELPVRAPHPAPAASI